jgi:hypothetical protein
MGKKKIKSHGEDIPKGAVLANYNKQKSEYPVAYYINIHFNCFGCGNKSTWTAEQQKKYFEEQSGNPYNTPKWCFSCHKKRMHQKLINKE